MILQFLVKSNSFQHTKMKCYWKTLSYSFGWCGGYIGYDSSWITTVRQGQGNSSLAIPVILTTYQFIVCDGRPYQHMLTNKYKHRVERTGCNEQSHRRICSGNIKVLNEKSAKFSINCQRIDPLRCTKLLTDERENVFILFHFQKVVH